MRWFDRQEDGQTNRRTENHGNTAGVVMASVMTSRTPMGGGASLTAAAATTLYWLALLSLTRFPGATGDCWLIEGEKGFVWLAICSQNQPPYESIPQHINNTILDLRLNENKIRSVLFSALGRFSNLTYLNLTKNDVSYIEDGAFSAQYNLQVLQLGFNRLRNLTEGMLRGLGKLQYLYLQANLIESVSPNTFEECPNIENIDLSMNRIQQLDGAVFSGLSRLSTCELYTNPFNCSCELLGFLRWLAMFPNRTNDRMACDTPAGFSGYFLVSQNPRQPAFRNALHVLSMVCEDSSSPPYTVGLLDATTRPPRPPPCLLDDCYSGDPPPVPEEPISIGPTSLDSGPDMRLKQVTPTSAVLLVRIPQPFRKMYILALYNNSFFTDIQKLHSQQEEVELRNLKPHTLYTYCVVSVRHALRHNHTCLTLSVGGKAGPGRTATHSSATLYIISILGCLFGMVVFLGVACHCLRRRRHREEKQRKMERIQRTLIELKYGGGGVGELEGARGSLSQLSQKQGLSAGESLSRLPYLGGELEQYTIQEIIETPKNKASYLEGSVAEISTIAKEVDKVNQIINNCIDALKSESTSFQAATGGVAKPGAMGTSSSSPGRDAQLMLISDQASKAGGGTGSGGGSGFLSPVYKGGAYHHPIQRHHSMEAPPSKRPSVSSSGSARSPRSYRPPGTSTHDLRYSEQPSSPAGGGGDPIVTVTPAAAILRAEAQRLRQYHEHRHSYPGPLGLCPDLPTLPDLPPHLQALSLGRAGRAEAPYPPLSPHYQSLSSSGGSSPEASCGPSLWQRFKMHRQRQRQEEEYVAAGHALRRKVQLAQEEDLHDILDYWKGVSSQQKA